MDFDPKPSVGVFGLDGLVGRRGETIQNAAEAGAIGMDGDMPDVRNLRIPVRYLANMLTAGDEEPVIHALERMLAMRSYMRSKTIDGVIDEAIAARVGLSGRAIEDMYKIMALADYEDRFVIPTTHREHVEEAFDLRGGCGFIVVPAGCRIGPREIAGIVAAGHDSVTVTRRIRVGILATGDEVRQPGAALSSAQICDVNTPMLMSSMQELGVDVVITRIGGDTPDEIRRDLQTLSALLDLVVTTGGISVGAADHVKPALRDAGGEIVLSGVAIKPGKPISVGRLGAATWLGLPGNPVSAFVTWTVFGRRILDRLSGHQTTQIHRRHVITHRALHHRPGRCELRLASIIGTDVQGREIASFPAQTHSARVSHLSNADGLIVVPAETDHIPEGGLVEFLPLPSN